MQLSDWPKKSESRKRKQTEKMPVADWPKFYETTSGNPRLLKIKTNQKKFSKQKTWKCENSDPKSQILQKNAAKLDVPLPGRGGGGDPKELSCLVARK